MGPACTEMLQRSGPLPLPSALPTQPCPSWAGQTLAFIQAPAPMKGSVDAAQFLSCLTSVPAGAHLQSPEPADVSAWASVAFTVLILFLPALTAANASSHTTLSCIAFRLHIFPAAFSAGKRSTAEA